MSFGRPPCGPVLERIRTGQGKSPDGWVLKYNQRRTLCEIKSPRDDELIDELEAARAEIPKHRSSTPVSSEPATSPRGLPAM